LERIRAERENLIKQGKIKRTKGKNTPSITRDNSHYGKLPDEWELVRLRDVGIYGVGKTPKADELHTIGLYPYFKVADMNTVGNEKYLITTDSFLGESYHGVVFPANSIVFPKNGGAVLTNKKRVLTCASVVDLNTGVYTPTELLDFEYVFWFFQTMDFSHKHKGGIIPTLDRSVIEDRFIPIPPLAEQARIASSIQSQFTILDVISSNI
jgi:type I restriction enzyme S subunit